MSSQTTMPDLRVKTLELDTGKILVDDMKTNIGKIQEIIDRSHLQAIEQEKDSPNPNPVRRVKIHAKAVMTYAETVENMMISLRTVMEAMVNETLPLDK